jgi:streptomycin 6-kinase
MLGGWTSRTRSAGESPAARQWLEDLDELIAALARDWGLSTGASLNGGTVSVAVEATTAEGQPAVLKLVMPCQHDGWEALAHEAEVLRLAQGRGCVRLLADDLDRGALLLERLGGQLIDAGLSTWAQMEVICSLLGQVGPSAARRR